MAYGTKYQWNIAGRERTWLIELQQDGFASAVTTLTGHKTAHIIWGETTSDLDARILPADMRLQVLDPEYVLFNELSAAGVEEDDYRVKVTDSEGEYTMYLRVRLETVKTLLFSNLEVPVTELYAYCGLSNLQTIDAVTLSSATPYDVSRYLLASQTQGQDIEYITGVYPDNVHTSGAVLDLWRLNRLDLMFQEEGRKRDNAESQLRGILEALDAALWNGFDGQWHLKHRFALGEYITGRGPQRYIHASASIVALSTLQMPTFAASAANMERRTLRYIEAPVQAVEIEQGPDAENRFVNINLIKYGDFEEGWVSSTEHIAWSGSSSIVARSTDSDSGTYALQINAVSPATVRQDIAYFSGGQPIRFHIVLRFGIELTSGGSGGSVSGKVRLVFDPYDAAEAAYYATASGWSTTPTDYNMTDTANPFGSGVSYQDLSIEVVDSLPSLDGLLYLQFTGDTTGNWVVRVDNVEVRLVDEGYNTTQTYKAVFHRLDNNTNPATKGGVIRQRRVWFPGTLWVDTDNNTIRDLAVPMIQADTDGAGDWQEADYWTSEIEGDIAQYDDLARWSAESRIGQQQDPLEVIEGEVLGILSPEIAIRYNAASYVPVYCDVDLAKETTRFVAMKKQRVFSSDAPFAVAGTVFFTSRSTSANTLVTANSLCRRNTDGSVDTLYTFTGSEPTALCLDLASRRVYTVQGQKIWGCFYDGTDMAVIYEHSGNTVNGIDYQPAGTYAGYLFYTTYTTGNDNDRLHRVTVTGTDQANVGNTMTAIPQPVVVSSTAIYMNTAFSTISIVSMPAAGGSYSTVKSGQTFNSIGLAVDVSGDRIWTTSNGDLEQTNFAGAAYTTVGSINNGTLPWWDATGARLFYGGLGLRYRAGGALGTELQLSPTTGGSGTTGAFSVNQIVVVQ